MNKIKLEEIAVITMGQSPDGSSYNTEGNGKALINGPTEFTNKYPVKIQYTSKPTKLCDSGDILICVRGSSTGRMNIADDEYCIGRGVAAIKAIPEKSSTEFIHHLLTFEVNKILNKATGSTFPNVTSKELKNLNVTIFSLDEQKRIASMLSTWDKAIELKEKLIEEKKYQKTGLMQKLLTGKVRLPGFEGEWKEVSLGDIMKNKTVKTTENDQHQILSCTKDGVVSQSEHFNKQIASTNNIGYKILKKGEVVLSPMNLWLGGIDISNFDIGIVSPAYKVYQVNYSLIGENYLRNLLRSEYMIGLYDSISQKGASTVRRNLSIKDFEALTIMIPNDFEEMNAIDNVLYFSSKEIDLLSSELEYLKEQKKGLMHLILTGIVRVNTKEN